MGEHLTLDKIDKPDAVSYNIAPIFIEGELTYSPLSNSWQLDHIDLDKHLLRFRDGRVRLIVAPLGAYPACNIALLEDYRLSPTISQAKDVGEIIAPSLTEQSDLELAIRGIIFTSVLAIGIMLGTAIALLGQSL